jgi:hypothetical protein
MTKKLLEIERKRQLTGNIEDCNCLDVAGQKKAAAANKVVMTTIEQTTQIVIFMMRFFREVFMGILYWLRVEL